MDDVKKILEKHEARRRSFLQKATLALAATPVAALMIGDLMKPAYAAITIAKATSTAMPTTSATTPAQTTTFLTTYPVTTYIISTYTTTTTTTTTTTSYKTTSAPTPQPGNQCQFLFDANGKVVGATGDCTDYYFNVSALDHYLDPALIPSGAEPLVFDQAAQQWTWAGLGNGVSNVTEPPALALISAGIAAVAAFEHLMRSEAPTTPPASTLVTKTPDEER